MRRKSLKSKILLLLVGLLAGTVAPARASSWQPEVFEGPCRIKLRTGRQIDATGLRPADESLAFWRLDLAGGGHVVLPVRELRGLEPLALAPSAPEEATVAPPPEEFLDGVRAGGCDPATSRRLARWDDLSAEAASRHGVDHALVRAIIAVESCGDPDAVSPKGALGLMQLMPATAREIGCSNPKDPRENIDAGVKHLAGLLQRLQGNLELAVAAYNAGEGAVAKAGGIPPFRETRNYVKSVKRHLARLGSAASAM